MEERYSLKKVNNRSYLVQAVNGQIYRQNRKHLCQTKERPAEQNQALEDSAEDELAIPFTERQQNLMQDNEQPEESPPNQNPQSELEHSRTRFSRVCNSPNRFKDYLRYS